jgi:hypothetical protein
MPYSPTSGALKDSEHKQQDTGRQQQQQQHVTTNNALQDDDDDSLTDVDEMELALNRQARSSNKVSNYTCQIIFQSHM